MKLTICPVCRGTVVIHEGEPPSTTPKHFKNRCPHHLLTGTPGKGSRGKSVPGHNSWWWPTNGGRGYCGAPVTDMNGAKVPVVITLAEFVDTTRSLYSNAALQAKAFTGRPELLRIARLDN